MTIFDSKGAAAFLGMSRSAFQSMVKRGLGPRCSLVDRQHLYRQCDLEAFLDNKVAKGGDRHKTLAETDPDHVAVAMLDRLACSWVDGRLSSSLGLTYKAIDRLLRPHLVTLVEMLATPRPFATTASPGVTPAIAWSDGRLAFPVFVNGVARVDICFDPSSGIITSSIDGAPVARGILALVAYVVALRTGRKGFGPPEAAEYLLACLGQAQVLSLASRPASAQDPRA